MRSRITRPRDEAVRAHEQRGQTAALLGVVSHVSNAVSTGKTWLYAKRGSAPTSTSYDCSGYCDIERPEGGTWYIRLEGRSPYTDTTLTADYTAPETTPHMGHGATVNNWPPRLPTSTAYDCASVKPGRVRQECSIPSPQAGDWYAAVRDQSGASVPILRASYAMTPGEQLPALTSHVSLSGQKGPRYSQKQWKLEVPPGQSTLWFATEHGTGSVNLKVKRGGRAVDGATLDCATTGTGNLKQCTFANPQPGTYFVSLTLAANSYNLWVLPNFR